jgi:hypothetical protein
MTNADWGFVASALFRIAFMIVIVGVASFYWLGGIPGIVSVFLLVLLMAVAVTRFGFYLPWYVYWLLLFATAAAAIIQYQMAKHLKPPEDESETKQ